MTIQKKSNKGFSTFKTIIVVFLVLAVVVIVLIIIHNNKKPIPPTYNPLPTYSSSNPTTSTNLYATLTPATVPSKTAECSQQVVFSSNGDSGPIQCSNGYLNVAEWNSLEALEPSVMTLGYGATLGQVQAALCADVKANISNVIEITSYQISVLYYGWNFSSNPTTLLSNGSCVNHDD